MKTYSIQKTVFSVVMASALAMLVIPSAANADNSPFTGAMVTPSQDVIAGNLDEITPQNTVTVVHTIAQVAPTISASQMPSPSSASFGVVTAFDNPNMSQQQQDCPPPPPPSCACGSNSPTWSGWDIVPGGVCLGSNTGGWYPGGCDACPPPPQPPTATAAGVGSFKTVYGYTWDVATGTYTTPNGQTASITSTQGVINGVPVTIFTAINPQGGQATSQIVSNGQNGSINITSVMATSSQLLQNASGTVGADEAIAGVGGSVFADTTISGPSISATATGGGGSCPVGDTSAACQTANNITNGGSFTGGSNLGTSGTTATGSISSVSKVNPASGALDTGADSWG